MADGLYQDENSILVKKRGIRDMDASVLSYYKDVLDIKVPTQDGNAQDVTVFLATAERRFLSDNPKLIDEHGTLKKPFIRIKRTGLDRAREGFYGSAGEGSSIQIAKQVHGKTNTVQNLSRARWGYTRPSNVIYEIYTLPFPDYSVATYELEIETERISTEENEIVETIFGNLDYVNSFKIPDHATKDTRKDNKGSEGFFYVGFLDTDVRNESNLDDYTDQERIIKTVLSFRVGCVIIGNTKNMPEAVAKEEGYIRMRKYYSSYKIKFGNTDETLLADTQDDADFWLDR